MKTFSFIVQGLKSKFTIFLETENLFNLYINDNFKFPIPTQTIFLEFCSLPNTFCPFSTEIPKILLRGLTHASVKSA